MIKKIIEDGDFVIFSDLNEKELLERYSLEKIKDIISIVPQDQLIIAKREKEDFMKAKNIEKSFGLHFADSVHCAFAERYSAILITRDKHFESLQFILTIQKPEDLI